MTTEVNKLSRVKFRDDVTVNLVKSSASDSDVVWAARVSTQGERSIDALEQDPASYKGLIRYLMREQHGVPFEHAYFTFYIEAPIFVTRQILKHRISSISETSGRYRVLDSQFYAPSVDRPLVQVGKTGDYNFVQGSETQYALTLHHIEKVCETAWDSYQTLINEGISQEIARVVLPFNTYSSMYITMNARSLMNFLSQRKRDERAVKVSHPQREVEMVAEKMEEIFAEKMPIVYDAFNDFGRVVP